MELRRQSDLWRETTEKAAASSEKPPEKGGALTGAAKKAREKAERAAERAGAHAAKAKERAKSVVAAKSGKSGGGVESSDLRASRRARRQKTGRPG